MQKRFQKRLNIDDLLAKLIVGNFGSSRAKALGFRVIGIVIIGLSIYNIVRVSVV